jgi:exodeoxyribonuclease V beta subunit
MTPEGGYEQLFESGYGDLEHNRIQYRREKLAESLRLLYVAVTRAKQFCCLAWGSVKETEDSALMYLTRNWTEPDMQSYLAQHGAELISGSGENFSKWAGNDAISLEKPFAEEIHYEYERQLIKLEARQLRQPVPADWGIMSFSSLSAGTHAGKDQAPGWDDSGTAVRPLEEFVALTGEEPESPFADFPAGPVSGDCVHEIFEKIDFPIVTQPGWHGLPEIKKLVKDNLLKFGLVDGGRDSARFEESLDERCSQIYGLLENVLNTPLAAGENSFRLSDVTMRRRVSEMEFFFHVNNQIRLDKMAELLQRKFYPEMAVKFGYGGGKAPMRGFMNGKIDLFFEHGGKYWIIDWKTNWLGRQYSAYNHEALTADMIAKTYLMQASIYALAVDKYLKFRLPDYDYGHHFGGVFYLYVRGMDGLTPGHGVFKMRPEYDFIRELSEIFPGGGQ